jgi:four helix bundle protein
MAHRFRDLIAWQRAMSLAERAYSVAGGLPRHEVDALGAQLRRSAISIAANIAEGNGRLHRGDYVHHLSIALGSLAELQTLLLLSARLYAIEVGPALTLSEETGRILNGLTQSLRGRRPTPDP